MTPHRVGLGMGSNHEKIYGKRLVTHSLEDLGGFAINLALSWKAKVQVMTAGCCKRDYQIFFKVYGGILL